MIQIAKDLVTEILKTYCKTQQIFYEEKDFERIKINPTAIVLAGKEQLRENRRKVGKWTDPVSGKHYVRSQTYERIQPVEVNLFHRTETDVDEILQALLNNLPKGIDDGMGNWVPIEPATIDWPPDQKERSLGVLIIRFIGGIYKDTELGKFTQLYVQS